MNLFNLTTQLVKQELPEEYFLHVITHTNKTDYRANGYAPIPSSLDENGRLNIELYVMEEPQLPDFAYDTPVVHTLALGQLPFGGGSGEINIIVTDGLGNKIGDTIVTTADADEVARPIPS